MGMRNFEQCRVLTKSPSWTVIDVFRWKVIPERFGGGIPYLRRFKDAWVKNHSSRIRLTALRYKLPPELLAGVCWIEVGGDPNIIDKIAFEIRVFDWSGPNFIGRNLAITSPPAKTSFGFVSIQLRTAASTLGLNVDQMSTSELRALSNCLEKDTYNIEIVAMHLRQLANFDNLSVPLGMPDIKIIGARYNRGTTPSLESIKKNTKYGDFIVKNWRHFKNLLSH